MINEGVITILAIVSTIYLVALIVRQVKYWTDTRILKANYDYLDDDDYNEMIAKLNTVDTLERRIIEFEDAPNKLCNTSCDTRQKTMIKLYERAIVIFKHAQAVELHKLSGALKKLEGKYTKEYEELKVKHNLPDVPKQWRSKLNHYD